MDPEYLVQFAGSVKRGLYLLVFYYDIDNIYRGQR